jgi:type II secretory pathway component PulJ
MNPITALLALVAFAVLYAIARRIQTSAQRDAREQREIDAARALVCPTDPADRL